MNSERLKQVLARIDRLNSEDPNTDVAGGVSHPRELLYSQRVTAWVLRLDPNAPEGLRIAARGQHVKRWTIPRDRYPRTRAGYLKWRETLKAFHADTVAGLMREAGYAEPEVQRVRILMSKRRLADDPDTQTLEDALCLLFLETQFSALRQKTIESTMRDVLRKTWGKMSAHAREEALKLPLAEADRQFLERALEEGGRSSS